MTYAKAERSERWETRVERRAPRAVAHALLRSDHSAHCDARRAARRGPTAAASAAHHVVNVFAHLLALGERGGDRAVADALGRQRAEQRLALVGRAAEAAAAHAVPLMIKTARAREDAIARARRGKAMRQRCVSYGVYTSMRIDRATRVRRACRAAAARRLRDWHMPLARVAFYWRSREPGHEASPGAPAEQPLRATYHHLDVRGRAHRRADANRAAARRHVREDRRGQQQGEDEGLHWRRVAKTRWGLLKNASSFKTSPRNDSPDMRICAVKATH